MLLVSPAAVSLPVTVRRCNLLVMKIIVSSRVATEYGKRIRAAAPGARIITPAITEDGAVRWSADPANADACLLS